MNKTITATKTGIAINYANGKSSFIPYEQNEQNEQISINVQRKYFTMNTIQKSMYRRLMYGMDAFQEEQTQSMTQQVIFRIKNDHLRAINALNQFKYERVYGDSNKLLAVIFPHVKLDYFKDGKYSNLPTLKECKITTVDIIDLWINHKLLSLNFYNLNEETIEL
jgi:hypothetical protein